jgi:protein SCO1/2
MGVAASHQWHFLHVPADQLGFRAKSYLTAVQKDSTEAVGFTHSGHFILVDRERHIRSFCDGTKPNEVTKLMKEIDFLLDESIK